MAKTPSISTEEYSPYSSPEVRKIRGILYLSMAIAILTDLMFNWTGNQFNNIITIISIIASTIFILAGINLIKNQKRQKISESVS